LNGYSTYHLSPQGARRGATRSREPGARERRSLCSTKDHFPPLFCTTPAALNLCSAVTVLVRDSQWSLHTLDRAADLQSFDERVVVAVALSSPAIESLSEHRFTESFNPPACRLAAIGRPPSPPCGGLRRAWRQRGICVQWARPRW
jgi:hypothetical protein